MKYLLLLSLCCFSFTAGAVPLNGTICKGPRIEWEHVSHKGGAGTPPGGVISHTDLRIDGHLVEHIEETFFSGSESEYSINFDENSRVILDSSNETYSGFMIYTISIEVEKLSSAADVQKISETVKCERRWAHLP